MTIGELIQHLLDLPAKDLEAKAMIYDVDNDEYIPISGFKDHTAMSQIMTKARPGKFIEIGGEP